MRLQFRVYKKKTIFNSHTWFVGYALGGAPADQLKLVTVPEREVKYWRHLEGAG